MNIKKFRMNLVHCGEVGEGGARGGEAMEEENEQQGEMMEQQKVLDLDLDLVQNFVHSEFSSVLQLSEM